MITNWSTMNILRFWVHRTWTTPNIVWLIPDLELMVEQCVDHMDHRSYPPNLDTVNHDMDHTVSMWFELISPRMWIVKYIPKVKEELYAELSLLLKPWGGKGSQYGLIQLFILPIIIFKIIYDITATVVAAYPGSNRLQSSNGSEYWPLDL